MHHVKKDMNFKVKEKDRVCRHSTLKCHGEEFRSIISLHSHRLFAIAKVKMFISFKNGPYAMNRETLGNSCSKGSSRASASTQ